MFIKKLIRGVVQTLILVSYISSTVVNAQIPPQSGERRGPPVEVTAACADME